jgi:T6SS, Phospholipase effector Tle1-like, catalytic domain
MRARHAMSIDENRADFARVPWGGVHNMGPERPDDYPDWLQQVWFAGNHSDVGGSYPENEALLSDIARMDGPRSKEAAGRTTSDGYGMKVDERYYLHESTSLDGSAVDSNGLKACGRSSPRRSCVPASSNGSQRKLACSTTTRPRHSHTGPGTSAAPQADGHCAAPPPSEEPH